MITLILKPINIRVMKNLLILITTLGLFFCGCFTSYSQEVKFNESKVLELKEVVECPDMTRSQLFENAQTALSEWLPNSNTKSSIDYSDRETGTIILKSKLYLGFKKANPICGWDCYADLMCQIKCKDGKYQTIIKVPTFLMEWSAAQYPTEEKIAIEHVFPEYDGYKTKAHYTKKAIQEFGPTVDKAMISLFQSLNSKMLNTDDDF